MESTSPWAVICEWLGHIGHDHQATKDKGGKFLVPEIEFYTIKVLKGGGAFQDTNSKSKNTQYQNALGA